jgi:dienelactone hydrolase
MMFLLLLLVQAEQRSESGLRYMKLGGGGGKAPMIIFLHGTYGNAAYWGGFAKTAETKGYIAVLPYSTGDGGMGDKIPRWGKEDIPKVVSLAREMQRKFGADPRRTHIAGFSNGAFFAFEIGLRNPEVFASILCMGGGCYRETFSERDKEVGCYIVHGTKDTSVGFEAGTQTEERLRAAGFKNVVFKEKTGKGHEIFFDEIGPYFEWVEKIKRKTMPGVNSSLKWQNAVDPEARSLVYVYSPKDEDNSLVDWLETEVFVDEQVIAQAADYACVRINRDEAAPSEGLDPKHPGLYVLEKGKVTAKFGSVSSSKAVVDKLKSLKPKK